MDTLTHPLPRPAPLSWAEANHRYVMTWLDWLRLVLHRRTLWLRSRWAGDGFGDGRTISDHQADLLLAGEDTEGLVHFLVTNREAHALTLAMQELSAQLDLQRDAFDAVGSRPALDELARRCGLNALETHLLLLCLAPEVDPGFATLYAYAQDDVRLAFATLHLAGLLFGATSDLALGEGVEHLGLLDPDDPLSRFGLLHLRAHDDLSPHSVRPVGMDTRLRDHLLGIPRRDERVAEWVRPLATLPVTPAQSRLAREIAQRFQEPDPSVINLLGKSGTGKGAVAAALAAELDRSAVGVDLLALASQPQDPPTFLARLAREALLCDWLLFADIGEIDPHDPTLARLVDQLVALPQPVILGSVSRWPRQPSGRRKLLPVAVPKADTGEQARLWRQALVGINNGKQGALNGSVDQLVQQFDFGPEEIAATVDAVASRRSLATADLWQASQEMARREMGDLAQAIDPLFAWDDIVLPPDVIAQLREMAAQVAGRATVYERWGFRAKLSRGLGISALFAGPSGTGKTMSAEVLANHLHLDLYRIDLSAVINKYIGETEKNLRRLFDAAEQGGAILFFDEADALFGKRTEVKDSHDRYANIEVSYLLQRMESYRGLAILATNRKSALDQAFLRRLRFVVDFPFPDPASRMRIWQGIFPAQAETQGLNPAILARLEIPGGNIRSIAVNAAFLAADAGEPIGMAHIYRAARREYTKIDRLVTTAEFGAHGEVPA